MQRTLSAFTVTGSLVPRRQQMVQTVMSKWTYLNRSEERVRRKIARRARAKRKQEMLQSLEPQLQSISYSAGQG